MKTAVVTGVDRGLGMALIEGLLMQGWNVIGGHLSMPSDRLLEIKNSAAERLTLIQVDVGDDRSVDAFGKIVIKMVNSVDILFNNAGILGKIEESIFDTLDFQDMLLTYNINSLGPLRVTHALLGVIMASELKCVVNISSEAGSISNNYREAWYGYCMSKVASNMGGDITHQKVKELGGRVLQIHPGYLKTYMHGHYNTEGELEANEAATAILKVVNDFVASPREEKALFIGYDNTRLPW